MKSIKISIKYFFLFFLIYFLIFISYKYTHSNIELKKNNIIVENNIAENIITNNIINNKHNYKEFSKDLDEKFIISKPFLPENENEIIKNKFFSSFYNFSNIRYHFNDIFLNRKLFIINYSYIPYERIDISKSYDENADYIYRTTGMLNITKLDRLYNIDNSINPNNFNHIHLSMGHDRNYILLSLVSIASILNTTNNDTFIHFHFVLIGAKFEDMKPIIALKYINQNVEFIFYNGKQAEYDFSEYGNIEHRGVGDYAKFLIPEIVNNTNKIIIFDSADIIAKKDLSEIYFFNLENNYFGFALDIYAGKPDQHYVFAKNKFYSNIGTCLVNIRLFRKDNLYMAGYFARLAYSYMPCPTQEMFFMISQYKFKYLPLKYNCPQFFQDNDENNTLNAPLINEYLNSQKNSPFRYTFNEIIEAESSQVINHLYTTKPYSLLANKKNGKIWINYAKMANISEKLKIKYQKAFLLYDEN